MRTLSPELRLADAALDEWARWAKKGVSEMGWPPTSILGRLIREGFTASAHAAAVVDLPESVFVTERAVLHLRDPERRVVIAQYLHWEPVECRARRCNMTVTRFNNLLQRARRSVADYLDGAAFFYEKGRVRS